MSADAAVIGTHHDADSALGTVNGYITSRAIFKTRPFLFDGTTLGLTRAAVEVGVEVGDTLMASYGGSGFQLYTMEPTGGGSRTPGGVWVGRYRP